MACRERSHGMRVHEISGNAGIAEQNAGNYRSKSLLCNTDMPMEVKDQMMKFKKSK